MLPTRVRSRAESNDHPRQTQNDQLYEDDGKGRARKTRSLREKMLARGCNVRVGISVER